MLKRESFPIAKIYVPVKRGATLRPEAVREIDARRSGGERREATPACECGGRPPMTRAAGVRSG
jgi:hypothetical protein